MLTGILSPGYFSSSDGRCWGRCILLTLYPGTTPGRSVDAKIASSADMLLTDKHSIFCRVRLLE
nr:MAG TPA: hypothetical protein [Caudoviricetes sp.]